MKNLLAIVLLLASMFLVGCKDDKEKAKYTAKEEESLITFIGKGLAVENTGTFTIKSNDIVVEGNDVKSGLFTIPVATLNILNLPDDLRAMLTDHLKSPDFFNMLKYPEVKFEITTVDTYKGSVENAVPGANKIVTGELTLLDKTNSVSFPARIDIHNNTLNVDGMLILDRTQWGMNYANDPALGEHYILPNVSVSLKVVARRTP
jgi:polyisoprenoid-binding protein YceI